MTFHEATALVAALYTLPLWWFFIRPRWPWDWKGKEKHDERDSGPRRPKWRDFDDY